VSESSIVSRRKRSSPRTRGIRGSVLGLFALLAPLAVPLRARPALRLPYDPCPSVLKSCLGEAPSSSPSRPVSVSGGRSPLTVTIPERTRLRRFTARDLRIGSVVTPRSLLLALASRIGLPESSARDWVRRTPVFVDGKRWRPGGLFGYTKPVLARGWIQRIDLVESPPVSSPAPPTGEGSRPHPPAPSRTDPSVVDVLLRNIRVSGVASVAAGFSSGSGPYAGGNAEDYNLLLDVHDRRGDALVLDFDYLRSTIPFFPYAYGYGYGYGGLPPP
jgi:hypothetical protein